MSVRYVALAAAALLVASACSAIGGLPSPVNVHGSGGGTLTPGPTAEVFETGAYSAAEFWQGVVPGGENVEHYDSLAAMTKAADAVVLGMITAMGTDPSRYQSLNLQGGMMYATLTLKVQSVLAGTTHEAQPGELNLAIFMTDSRQYARFAAGLPTEQAIFFLRNSLAESTALKESPLPSDAVYYRVVSDQGLIRDAAGAAVPVTTDDGFLMAINGQPFETVVAQVQAAAAK